MHAATSLGHRIKAAAWCAGFLGSCGLTGSKRSVSKRSS